MLTEEHFELFRQFRIKAMGDKLREMVEDESYDRFTFEEKMEMLIDAEAAARRERKVAKLVKDARFKDPSACVEDVVYLPDRTLAKGRYSTASPDASGSARARSSWSSRKPAAARASSFRLSATRRAAG